ncbi:hypothetical protein HPB50_008655 [Hyalomma asiaticum]|uniref:Uncharacterized protein n=1 Tax=Hyalomma asiaticum TaxID=266040 RepID=A0ACB7S7K1_HYAAI|nr:hypothetical protein HPB50_008655 [Hyalomma asiaticum]
MSRRHKSNTTAKHERLMDELVRRLESMSDSPESRNTFQAEPPETISGAAGEPLSLLLPGSAISVVSCGCHQHEKLHLHVTIKCPCARPSTAEAATQTDPSPVERPQVKFANRTYEGASRCAHDTGEQLICYESSVHLGATSTKSVSSHRAPLSAYHVAGPKMYSFLRFTSSAAVSFAEDNLSTQGCLRSWGFTPSLLANEEFSPRVSADERRRSVHEALAQVPTGASATADATLYSTDDQTTMESMYGNVNPPVEAKRYIISDELGAIYEHIESRWAEVCAKLRADLNGRYDKFIADCRSCLQNEPGECERDQLRHEMADARRELIAQLKEVFRSACDEFDYWRMRYLERELQLSCSTLQTGDRFRVMAAVLRYEILEGLPELEKRTRERAAALWKELVEQQWIDVDVLFDA